MMGQRFLTVFVAMFMASFADGSPESFCLSSKTGQLIVALAADWDSSHVVIQRWEKDEAGKWRKVGAAIPARVGRNGLAWGRGLNPEGLAGPVKKEGDARAPAGVFDLGGVYGADRAIRKHPGLSYMQVTPYDMWVEDPDSKDYNRHIRLKDHLPETPWEKKQQMRWDDPAHRIKLFIAHNSGNDRRPGAGSAIFFHVWRFDGEEASTGCTVLAETPLRECIAWIDPGKRPLYILLPLPEYGKYAEKWKLPRLEEGS